MRHHDSIYIDGAWREAGGAATIAVIDPSREAVCGHVPDCGPELVDQAVCAARGAFAGWSGRPLAERTGLLRALAAAMKARAGEIAETISGEMGMAVRLAKMIQTDMPIANIAAFADLADAFPFETEEEGALIVCEPIGVCGFITPWNYPLHQIVGKVAPALAAGCTVVLKPSEVAPLCAFLLAEIIDAVGFPPGVFNLVSGTGPLTGEALVAHPEVDMISFTGSTRAGRRVAELAAPTVKRVTQELGGKSANIILEDADFRKAVTKGVQDCFLNSGQTCSALTRMLVPASRHDEAAEIARSTAENTKLAPASAPGFHLGPLVSERQRARVRDYIAKGIEEGAHLVTGGAEPPAGHERGFFVRPTVFAAVSPAMTIAREEIFGPVLAIMPYRDIDEAVAIANDSDYGLSGAVWSGDPEKARAVARRIRTGQVTINGARFNPKAPFGGYKQSGNGREFGSHGLREFLEVKAIIG